MVRLKVRDFYYTPQNIIFQFQYGTIKSPLSGGYYIIEKDFNSSMVRLKERNWQDLKLKLNDFNSSMVRLKEFLKNLKIIQHIISIPVWYD